MSNDFWKEYWRKDEIIFRANRQSKVGRTVNGQPISDENWNKTVSYVAEILKCEDSFTMLDVCAGSGVFTDFFSEKVAHIDALDISEELLNNIKSANVNKVVADLIEVSLEYSKYNRVLFYFALQHFRLDDLPTIMKKIHLSCKKGALVFIGDIPNIEKKSYFSNDEKRKTAYFQSLIKQEPIIGEWFFKSDLLEMAHFVGFEKATILDQPDYCINAHYRFDLLLEV